MHHFEAATCMLQQYTSPYNPSLGHISDHKLIHLTLTKTHTMHATTTSHASLRVGAGPECTNGVGNSHSPVFHAVQDPKIGC